MTANDLQLLYLCVGLCYATFITYEIFRTIYKPDTPRRIASRAKLDDQLGTSPLSEKAVMAFLAAYQIISWMLMVLFWPVDIVRRIRRVK